MKSQMLCPVVFGQVPSPWPRPRSKTWVLAHAPGPRPDVCELVPRPLAIDLCPDLWLGSNLSGFGYGSGSRSRSKTFGLWPKGPDLRNVPPMPNDLGLGPRPLVFGPRAQISEMYHQDE